MSWNFLKLQAREHFNSRCLDVVSPALGDPLGTLSWLQSGLLAAGWKNDKNWEAGAVPEAFPVYQKGWTLCSVHSIFCDCSLQASNFLSVVRNTLQGTMDCNRQHGHSRPSESPFQWLYSVLYMAFNYQHLFPDVRKAVRHAGSQQHLG